MLRWPLFGPAERRYNRSVLHSFVQASFTEDLQQKFAQPASQYSPVPLSPLGLPWEALRPRRKLPLLGRPQVSIRQKPELWALYKTRYASLRLKVIVHFWNDKALIVSTVWQSSQKDYEQTLIEALEEKYGLDLQSPPSPLIADKNGALLLLDPHWQQLRFHYLRPNGLTFLHTLQAQRKSLAELKEASLRSKKASLKKII